VTSQVELLARACVWTGGILTNVTSKQLTHPTPCDDWRVHDLINHIVGATGFFADIAQQGSSAEGREWRNYSDGDFAVAFGQQASRVVGAFAAPGAMERTMLLPTGPASGTWCIQVATGEIFVHGWDLAQATGQAMPPDEGVAEALLSSEWLSLCAEVRNGDPSVFAPEIHLAREAPAVGRLAGFLGRDPNWHAGP
jgi:uncharacterized protein (TIGR03086 family)